MNHSCRFVLLAGFAIFVLVARAASVTLGTGEAVHFAVPDAWASTPVPEPAPGVPSVGKTVHYAPLNGANATVMITVMAMRDDALNDPKALRALHEGANASYAESSVEREVISTELKSLGVRGFLSTFTDSALVGKGTEPGNFKTVTVATLYLGDRVVVAASILCDRLDDAEFRAGLAIVKSLRLRLPANRI